MSAAVEAGHSRAVGEHVSVIDGIEYAVDELDARPWEFDLRQCSADRECEHGRLAGDVCPSPVVTFNSHERKGLKVQSWPHAHPCGCWPEELPRDPFPDTAQLIERFQFLPLPNGVPPRTPDLLSILTPRKEPLMLTAAPAPYGLKLDGTPRKSNAGRKPGAILGTPPRPEGPRTLAEHEAEGLRAAVTAAAHIEPPQRVTPVTHITSSRLLAKLIGDFDAEIARLTAARDALAKVAA